VFLWEVNEGKKRMLCKCGCGKKTKLHTKTSKKQGRVKGLPNDYVHGHNQSFWGKIGEKMNRENFVLVPAQMRQRKRLDYMPPVDFSKVLRTAEETAAAKEAAAAEQRAEEEQKAAEEASFQKRKAEAEEMYAARFPHRARKLVTDGQL
jgi:hypothetical protein